MCSALHYSCNRLISYVNGDISDSAIDLEFARIAQTHCIALRFSGNSATLQPIDKNLSFSINVLINL